MARVTRTTKKTSRSRTVAPVLAARGELQDRLTAEILQLDSAGKLHLVRNVVEIGARLHALQSHLGFGRWLTWLSNHLPYSPRTAQRYIAVAQWSQAQRSDFNRFAHLGLTKLQVLALLPASERRALRPGRGMATPSGVEKTLEVMTAKELERVVNGSEVLAAVPSTVPIGAVIQRLRSRVAGIDALTDELRRRADEVDEGDVRELYEEVLEVAIELEGAFGF